MDFRMEFFARRAILQDISSSPLARRGSPSQGNIAFIPEAFYSPSPEEQIIQQRSQSLHTPTALELCFQDFENDTGFLQATPAKEPLTQLCRKRLLLAPPNATSSPVKEETPVKPKRPRLEKKRRKPQTPLNKELKAYSPQQLVDVLDRLVASHPELEKEVRHALTAPDLRPLEDQLSCLRKNVYKALPRVRYTSSRDAHCFQKVKVHLHAFKKACVEQGKKLVSSQCWESVVMYVLSAWRYIHQLPKWDTASHNASRDQCFRALASQCMVALKQGRFKKNKLEDLINRFEKAAMLSSEIQPCLDLAMQMLKGISY